MTYANGAVESLWSIEQYFQFVLVLMLSTGLSFQVWMHCKPVSLVDIVQTVKHAWFSMYITILNFSMHSDCFGHNYHVVEACHQSREIKIL